MNMLMIVNVYPPEAGRNGWGGSCTAGQDYGDVVGWGGVGCSYFLTYLCISCC